MTRLPLPIWRFKSAAFDESDHPRDHGKFSEKPGGSGSEPDAVASLSPRARAAYALLTAGTPEERAARARALVGEGKPTAPVKPATKRPAAPKGGAKPAAESPPTDPKAARKAVADAIDKGLDGDPDPMGLRKAGFPGGADRDEFRRSAAAALAGWWAKRGHGMQFDEAYQEFGSGLSKADFVRALVDGHDAGAFRMGGWGREADDLPDPELAAVLSGKLFYNLYPADRTKGFRLPPAPLARRRRRPA